MTQLNETQISSLFDFVSSKYVRYIDVQYELVDHLASDIEIEMDTDSSISFDDALKNVYAKFPITSFSNYVSESESAMNRMWQKIILSQFTPFGGIPILMILASLIFIQYQLISTFGTPIFYVLMISVILFGFLSVWGLKSVINDEDENRDDKYLVVSIFKNWAMMFSLFPFLISQILIDFRWIHPIQEGMTLQIVSFSVLFSLSFVWSAMAFYKFPELIRTVLAEKYTHLKLSV